MKKISLFIAIITITASYSLTAQLAITTDGSAPDGSAMLEVKSTDKGMLIPRVALTKTTDETTISSPAVSLMIYNCATAQDIIPGFYYWNGAAWVPAIERADGTETKVTSGTNVTVTGVGTTASPYVVNARGATNYSVGDFAHGGIVFWVDETGQHGLVCTKRDQATKAKYMLGTMPTQAKGNGPYAGKANTALIIAAHHGHSDDRDLYAARICYALQITEGGRTYADWYLPSKYELNLLYENKAIIDSTATAPKNEGSAFASTSSYYWSSNENTHIYAWQQNFHTSNQYASNKWYLARVRAVRAF